MSQFRVTVLARVCDIWDRAQMFLLWVADP